MNKYAFRLANVLQHRERIEDQAKQVFAQIERSIADEEAKLDVIKTEYETVSDTLNHSHASLDNEDLRMHYARVDFLARSIRTREATIVSMKLEREAARKELLKASQDRRVLETLKERREADHIAETVRLEHAHLDDANGRRSHQALEPMRDST